MYCPGCGGSRAAIALLQGDILQSLKYNPITLLFFLDVLLMIIIDVVKYVSKGKYVFSRLRLISNISFLAFLGGYFLLRNYVLLVHGVDWLGDFSR